MSFILEMRSIYPINRASFTNASTMVTTTSDAPTFRQRLARAYVLNPVLEEKSGEQYGDEGCLSVPGLWYKTRRADYARVRGIDLDGNEAGVDNLTGLDPKNPV